jgi:hypothetical protein
VADLIANRQSLHRRLRRAHAGAIGIECHPLVLRILGTEPAGASCTSGGSLAKIHGRRDRAASALRDFLRGAGRSNQIHHCSRKRQPAGFPI